MLPKPFLERYSKQVMSTPFLFVIVNTFSITKLSGSRRSTAPSHSLSDFRLYGLSASNQREEKGGHYAMGFHFRLRLSSVPPSASSERPKCASSPLPKAVHRAVRYVYSLVCCL